VIRREATPKEGVGWDIASLIAVAAITAKAKSAAS